MGDVVQFEAVSVPADTRDWTLRPRFHVECDCGERFISALNIWENYHIRGEAWTEWCPSCKTAWLVELTATPLRPMRRK